MPIVEFAANNPFVDGRQSDRALSIRRGVERYLMEAGHAVLPELSLDGGRRADLVALCPKGRVTIVEVKSSEADLRADSKWPDYIAWCDRFYFATLPDVPGAIFPEEFGLLVADSYGAHPIRETPEHPIPPARRKKLHLRFARAGAQRLAQCCEHAGLNGLDFVEP